MKYEAALKGYKIELKTIIDDDSQVHFKWIDIPRKKGLPVLKMSQVSKVESYIRRYDK